MDQQLTHWKAAAERLWSASSFDHREAAQLAAEIAERRDAPVLQQAAAQALPSLRASCVKDADRRRKEMAQRLFGAVRDALHALTMPRFGRRQGGGFGSGMPTPEERHRRLLGLPLGRRLERLEIHQAFKQAAKRYHPDTGGDPREFLALANARDALIKSE